MMGIKERAFGPLPPVSLEDLVPPDHFYRHLERALDLREQTIAAADVYEAAIAAGEADASVYLDHAEYSSGH
jgi:hypothetical protein